jgi:hypothetical protein
MKYYSESRTGKSYTQRKERRLTGLNTSRVGNAVLRHVTEGKIERRESVSSYWMALRKREYAGN